MKRLALVLMMLMLPLQFSWAAVSAYCRHEEGQAAQHFGHHDHQHGAAADRGQDDSGSPTKPHSDCGSCHLSTCGITAPMLSAPFVSCDLSPPSWASGDSPTVYPDGPERPKWMSAA